MFSRPRYEPLFTEIKFRDSGITVADGLITYTLNTPFPATSAKASILREGETSADIYVVIEMHGTGMMSCQLRFPLPVGAEWENVKFVNMVDSVEISFPQIKTQKEENPQDK